MASSVLPERVPSKYAAAHAAPAGPGDARPTALALVHDEQLVDAWTDKVVLCTGASAGIGVETARAIYATGADLYLPVRDVSKGESVAADICSSLPDSRGRITVLHMELESLQSVRECAREFLQKSGNNKLNVLICNAGTGAQPARSTRDGLPINLGVNHVAHFLLFQLLKAALLSSATASFNSRVVVLSSVAHKMSPVHFGDLDLHEAGHDMWVAYGQSKTANLYMATEIDRRYGAQALHATAVHPGGIFDTGLSAFVPAEWTAAIKSDPRIASGAKNLEQGAATTVWAATSGEWEGKGGKYLEDCNVAQEIGFRDTGFAEYAYDQQAAQKLWTESFRLAGMEAADD